MSLSIALSELAESLSRWKQLWAVTENEWRDQTQQAFVKTYLEPLATQTQELQRELQALHDSIERAKHEVK